MGIYPTDSYSLKSRLKIDYADTTFYHGSELTENKSYSFPLIKSIDQDTISSVHGFVHLRGKFPQVPIQLHQISLGKKENNKDSINNLQQPIVDEMLQVNPKMTIE